MTFFPYQRPLTLRLWKIKVDSRVQIPQKTFARGYSPASTSLTLLLCPHPHPLPRGTESSLCFFAPAPTLPPPPPRTESSPMLEMGGDLLNFELISALIR